MNGWVIAGATVAALTGTAFLVEKLRLFGGRWCKYSPSMIGKVVVITGTTSGIGRESALKMARLGASLVFLDRDLKRSAETAALAQASAPNGTPAPVLIKCDLSDLLSIKQAAQNVVQRFPEIHVLMNNAGLAAHSPSATRQGWEVHYGVNHLGPFALTTALLPALLAGQARVVCTASVVHTIVKGIRFDQLDAGSLKKAGGRWSLALYGQSKLANVLFANELQRRYGTRGLTAFSVHPGLVRTSISRDGGFETWVTHAFSLFSKTAEEGAQTQLHCALAPIEELVPGEYYADCAVAAKSSAAKDEELGRRLWETSEAQVSSAN